MAIQFKSTFASHSSEDEISRMEQVMENNIYYWQVDVMLYLRMKEIRQEMEKGAHHKGDELHRSYILKKLVLSIGKGLVGLGRRMQSMYTDLNSQY